MYKKVKSKVVKIQKKKELELQNKKAVIWHACLLLQLANWLKKNIIRGLAQKGMYYDLFRFGFYNGTLPQM